MKSRKPNPIYPLRQEVPGVDGMITWSLGGHALTITPETDPDKLKAAKLAAYSRTAWGMGYRALSYELAKHTPFFPMGRDEFERAMCGRHGGEPSIPASERHPFHIVNRWLEDLGAMNEVAEANGVETVTLGQYIERVNAGTNRGFTLETLREQEAGYRQRSDDLEVGKVSPARIAGQGATKAEARQWLDEQLTAVEMGLLTDGAVVGMNVSSLNASIRDALREVVEVRAATLEIPVEDLSYPGPRG